MVGLGVESKKPWWQPGPYTLKDEHYLNLTGAIHHTSGANAFSFECAHGVKGHCTVSWEQILEIQFALYEVMMEEALNKR